MRMSLGDHIALYEIPKRKDMPAIRCKMNLLHRLVSKNQLSEMRSKFYFKLTKFAYIFNSRKRKLCAVNLFHTLDERDCFKRRLAK